VNLLLTGPLPANGVRVVIAKDPLRPLLGAEVRELPTGITAATALMLLDDAAPARPLCWQGASALLRSHPLTGENEWETVRFLAGDVLYVTPPPPADSEGGSNPIAMVAMIALMVVAPELAIALELTGIAATALTVAVTVAGGFLINALFPPSAPAAPPPLPGPGEAFRATLSGQIVRAGERIPELHGTVRFAPKWIAPPYGEFADNEHLVFALYSLGRDKVRLDRLEFEDTVIWTAADGVTAAGGALEIEIVEPGDPVTLFPAAVTSSSEPAGTKLRAENELEGGETTDDLFLGPFAACPAGQVADRIGVDIEWPGAMFKTVSNRIRQTTVTWRVEAREIDDNGDPVEGAVFELLGAESFTAGTTTPQRLSKLYAVDRGRYEVRVRRTNNTVGTSAASDRTVWSGLKGFVPSDQVFDDETVLAIRFKGTAATAQSRTLFAVATGIHEYWDADAEEWVEGPTAAIEAAARHIAQDVRQAGLADHRVDLATLQALAETWAARGDTFNHLFTGDATPWEELTAVLRAGRAQPIRIGADLTFWRDEPQPIPVAAFAPHDIVRGSLQIRRLHVTSEDANAARVLFTDAAGVERDVIAALDGIAPDRVADVRFTGIDNFPQAWREGVTEAAAHRYRRLFVTFSALKRGRFLRRGQKIALAHYRPAWGQSAMATGLSPDGRTLTLDEPFALDPEGGDHVIGLVAPDGELWGPVKATVGAHERTLVIDAADLADYLAEPAQGRNHHSNPKDWIALKRDGRKATRAMFGKADQVWRELLILDTEPRPDGTVAIAAVVDDARVHTAETDTAQPEEVAAAGLGANSSSPVWLDVKIALRDLGDAREMTLVGPSAPGAVLYRARFRADGGDYAELTPSAAPELKGIVPDVDDSLVVEYWAEGPGGEGTRIVRNISDQVTPPDAVDAASFALTEQANGDLDWTWDTVEGAASYDVEFLGGAAADSLSLKRTEIAATGAASWTADEQAADGGPFRTARIRVRSVGSGGVADPAADTWANPAPSVPTGLTTTVIDKNRATVSCNAVGDADVQGYVVAFATSPFSPGGGSQATAANPSITLTGLYGGNTYYVRMAAHDGTLTGLNWTGQTSFQTPALNPGEGP
jgi:hypothetical protein